MARSRACRCKRKQMYEALPAANSRSYKVTISNKRIIRATRHLDQSHEKAVIVGRRAIKSSV